jgi:mono/diheme cytochrome c family protein
MTRRQPIRSPLVALLALAAASGCTASASDVPREPHTVADSPVEAGRYLITVAGCNDCHTDGYLFNDGDVPEAQRFLGSSLGWRGPWGTSYARNLRITVTTMTEDGWVAMLKTRTGLPPMPWFNVSQMAEADMRAIYQYLRSMGPAGEQPPNPVPPDQEPTTAYISLLPVQPTMR